MLKLLNKIVISFAILITCAGTASAVGSYRHTSYKEKTESVGSKNTGKDCFYFDHCTGLKASFSGGDATSYYSYSAYDYIKFGRFFLQSEITYAKEAGSRMRDDYVPPKHTYTDEITGQTFTYTELDDECNGRKNYNKYNYFDCLDFTLLYGVNYEGLISLINIYGGNTISFSEQETGFRFIAGISHMYNHIPVYSDFRIELSNTDFRNSIESKVSIGYAHKF